MLVIVVVGIVRKRCIVMGGGFIVRFCRSNRDWCACSNRTRTGSRLDARIIGFGPILIFAVARDDNDSQTTCFARTLVDADGRRLC